VKRVGKWGFERGEERGDMREEREEQENTSSSQMIPMTYAYML